MTLDFMFHGGGNLNAKMYGTDGFDDVCRKAFERWHLRVEGNLCFPVGRFLELPVTEASERLAIRTFWVKEPGKRAECFYLGIRLTKNDYREAGDYYRLITMIRALSFEKLTELVRSGRKLELALTTPMQRQSMWRDFGSLSGTRLIGEEKFEENLDDILLSISVNNIDDWFDQLCFAIDPAVDRPEFNVIVSRSQPKRLVSGDPSVVAPRARPTPVCESKPMQQVPIPLRPREVFGAAGLILACGVVIGRIWGAIGVDEKMAQSKELTYKQAYDAGLAEGRMDLGKPDDDSEGTAHSAVNASEQIEKHNGAESIAGTNGAPKKIAGKKDRELSR